MRTSFALWGVVSVVMAFRATMRRLPYQSSERQSESFWLVDIRRDTEPLYDLNFSVSSRGGVIDLPSIAACRMDAIRAARQPRLERCRSTSPMSPALFMSARNVPTRTRGFPAIPRILEKPGQSRRSPEQAETALPRLPVNPKIYACEWSDS